MRLSQNKISTAKFKKLSSEKQELIINNIKHSYIDENLSRDEVLNKYEIGLDFFKWLIRTYNIKKDKKLVQQNIDKTFIEKYGRTGWANRDKIKETMIEKYGVDNPSKSKEIIEQRNKTNQERYGGNAPACSDEVQAKIQQTCLNKYGVTNIRKSYDIKKQIVEKMSKTIQEKYGVPYYCMTEECKQAQGHIISKINLRFAKLLDSNNIPYELEFNLGNRSYDFKVGDILIEIDPTYTHNSTIGPFINNQDTKAKAFNYHLNKSLKALESGFRCIHVFDNDDWNKIINILKSKTIIYARNCIIKEVNRKKANDFLINYHLQNACRGQKVCLGLYYNDELIQLMTFGKPRYNKQYQWELLRLCTHKDYVVTGGSQKLFKHFINNYDCKSIISYCDFSKFNGKVYESLGFKKSGQTKPVGNWYDIEGNFISDALLRQRGFDQLFGTNFGKGTCNEELMILHGWVRVFNCGQMIFVFN